MAVDGFVWLQVNEKVSQYACYMFEPLDLSQWSVAHEEDDMIVSAGLVSLWGGIDDDEDFCRCTGGSLRKTM